MANGRNVLPIAGTRCQGKVATVTPENIVAGKLEAGNIYEWGGMWASWIGSGRWMLAATGSGTP